MRTWKLENAEDTKKKFILWLLFPLLSLVSSLSSIRTKSSFIIIFLILLQIGLCMTMTNIRTEGSGDAISYRANFEDASRYLTENEFMSDAHDYFVTHTSFDKDYYDNTLIYIVSRFTDNYHIFFLFAAFIPAIFMLKYFKYYVLDENFKLTVLSIIPIIWFLLGHINAVAGVRYYTASWVSLYAMYKVFLEKKNAYIILSFLASLIHIGLISMFFLTIIGVLTRKFEFFWRVVFFVSIVFSSFSLLFMAEITAYLPDSLAQIVIFYTSEEEVQKEVTGTGFYMVGHVFDTVRPYVLMCIVAVFMVKKEEIKNNQKTKGLYLFLIIVAAYANFFLSVPDMGSRVMMRTELPLICYIWMSNAKSLKKYRWILWVYLFFMIFTIRHQLTQYLSYMQFDFYVGSPIYLLLKYAI